jgi:hypothetical protein
MSREAAAQARRHGPTRMPGHAATRDHDVADLVA